MVYFIEGIDELSRLLRVLSLYSLLPWLGVWTGEMGNPCPGPKVTFPGIFFPSITRA
jgi:hypothetical protein